MQKRYSKEFKEILIAFYHSGQSVTQLSKEVLSPKYLFIIFESKKHLL
ncbi:hypothetical protein ASN88_01371 [Streptococcus parauberis]|nr:hypothetical protein [Streptococcus parauberis]PNY21457.1 hypothetical protein ASN88_01371 [Streptococcus parauberis]